MSWHITCLQCPVARVPLMHYLVFLVSNHVQSHSLSYIAHMHTAVPRNAHACVLCNSVLPSLLTRTQVCEMKGILIELVVPSHCLPACDWKWLIVLTVYARVGFLMSRNILPPFAVNCFDNIPMNFCRDIVSPFLVIIVIINPNNVLYGCHL